MLRLVLAAAATGASAQLVGSATNLSSCAQDADCTIASDLEAKCRRADGAATGDCVCSNGERPGEAGLNVCVPGGGDQQLVSGNFRIFMDIVCADVPSEGTNSTLRAMLARVFSVEKVTDAKVGCKPNDDPTKPGTLYISGKHANITLRRASELMDPLALAAAVEAEVKASEGLGWLTHAAVNHSDLIAEGVCTLPNAERTLQSLEGCHVSRCRTGYVSSRNDEGCIETTPVPTAAYACSTDRDCQLAGDAAAHCAGSGAGQRGICVCSSEQPAYRPGTEPPADGRVCMPAVNKHTDVAFRFAFDADCTLVAEDRLEVLERVLRTAIGSVFSVVPTCHSPRLALQGVLRLWPSKVAELAKGADFAAAVDAAVAGNATLRPLGAVVPGSARLTVGRDCPLPNATLTVQVEGSGGACVAVQCAPGFAVTAPAPLEASTCLEVTPRPPSPTSDSGAGGTDVTLTLGFGLGLGLGLPCLFVLVALGFWCCRRKQRTSFASENTQELRGMSPAV